MDGAYSYAPLFPDSFQTVMVQGTATRFAFDVQSGFGSMLAVIGAVKKSNKTIRIAKFKGVETEGFGCLHSAVVAPVGFDVAFTFPKAIGKRANQGVLSGAAPDSPSSCRISAVIRSRSALTRAALCMIMSICRVCRAR